MAKRTIADLLRGRTQFGLLTVVGEGDPYLSPTGTGYPRALCLCECGNERHFSVSQLTTGKRRSCGCNNPKFIRNHPTVFGNRERRPAERIEDLPKSNREAAQLGITRYFTGKPCVNGHVAIRWTANQFCSECAVQSGIAYHRKYPIRTWANGCFCRARRSAAMHDLPFNITRPYIESLWTEFCPALGIKLLYASLGVGRMTRESATLDRIVPRLGYVIGNVAVISHRANSIKNDAGAEDIQKVADWLRGLEKK